MSSRHRLEVLLAVAVVVLGALWVRAVYVPSFADRHVAASEQRYHFDVGDPGPWFSAWSLGDGQAFALIALDPTGHKLDDEVKISAYRFTRAGYGWAVWAASLGRARAVPYALAAVGALAVIANLVLAVHLRGRIGPRAWLLMLNPALYIGFAGDTSEPMGVLFLGLAMASGSWVAAVFLGVTRPTFLVGLWGRWKMFLPGVVGAGVVAAYGILVLQPRLLAPGGGLALPLVGYFQRWSISGALLCVAALATLFVGVRSGDWAWVLSAALVLCFGVEVLTNPVNAWRTAGFLPVLWAFGPRYELATTTLSRGGTEAAVG
jgi:hypothetical protein